MVKMIISGGQTGVDQGALDFAIERGIPHGGFCPAGRKCETGHPISMKYNLWETEVDGYTHRTRRNVLHATGTLIIRMGKPSGGTKLTGEICNAVGRPKETVDLKHPLKLRKFVDFMIDKKIVILNVAGPRESKHPGIQKATARALHKLWDAYEAELKRRSA